MARMLLKTSWFDPEQVAIVISAWKTGIRLAPRSSLPGCTLHPLPESAGVRTNAATTEASTQLLLQPGVLKAKPRKPSPSMGCATKGIGVKKKKKKAIDCFDCFNAHRARLMLSPFHRTPSNPVSCSQPCQSKRPVKRQECTDPAQPAAPSPRQPSPQHPP